MTIWWTSDARLWAGGTYLLTCVLLGIATLGAILGRGKPREIWIGASLFGVGYLYMAMVSDLYPYDGTAFVHPRATDEFLDALRPLLPPVSSGTAAANERIVEGAGAADPDAVPQRDTAGQRAEIHQAGHDDARSIPVSRSTSTRSACNEAERSLNSTVRIDLEGFALKVTLDLCLRQLGLYYVVKDGFVWISSDDAVSEPGGEESFRVVGHSLLALLAAGLGGVLAPLVSAVSRERAGRGRSEECPCASPIPLTGENVGSSAPKELASCVRFASRSGG